ncbi:MAG: hypothetical protein ACRDH7_07735 [Actinomycetota bacterium]
MTLPDPKQRRNRRLAGIAVATFLLASLATDAAWASTSRALASTCAVSPSSGLPGAAVVISGTGWRRNATVNLSFVQLGAVTALAGATADRRGIFSGAVSVPENARATAASFVVKGRRRSTQDVSCSVAFAVLPIPTAAWGVDAYSAPTGAIDTLETDMGRPFAAWAGYRRIDDASTYLHFIAAPMSRDALVYLNINNYALDPTTGAHVPYCWSSVSNGSEDTMIDAWAQVILASAYMDRRSSRSTTSPTSIRPTSRSAPPIRLLRIKRRSTTSPGGYEAME